jgi:hypothetical protein
LLPVVEQAGAPRPLSGCRQAPAVQGVEHGAGERGADEAEGNEARRQAAEGRERRTGIEAETLGEAEG